MPHPVPYHKDHPLPELLAPAGSPDAFRAAVAAGADAVYLSGKQFGARQYAQNFTNEEIADAVAYAHARGIRVYVTVNTLVHDRELAVAGEYLIWLYSIGADAVLVQDIGLAALARQIVPDLPLHASTQMTIHNADGVLWAAGQGFSRVVLPRELSLNEVEAIARETENSGVGLEVFVHGALCYCYSGQCLLSSVIGGRSGNRGMCAQPCRKPYTLVTGEPDAYGRPLQVQDVPLEDRYLLSTKDLCTYPEMERLIQSPVVSLKIEGRMRSADYVAIVVSTYRRALDSLARDGWTPQESDKRDLMLAFNRGFTTGYLFGERSAALMGRNQPDNRGLLIGTVAGYRPRTGEATIILKTTFTPVAGDGLLFKDPDHAHEGFGFSLNTTPKLEKGMIILAVPRPVKRGTPVMLTSSTALTTKARQIIASPSTSLRRPVPIDLEVRVNNEGIPLLEGMIDTGKYGTVNVSCVSSVRLSPARTRPLTADQFEEQLRKTGSTPFAIRRFMLDYNGRMFAPVSEINRIRREFLSQAYNALITASRPSDEAVKEARGRWAKLARLSRAHPPALVDHQKNVLKLSVYANSIDVVRAASAAGCDTICFEPDIPVGSSSVCCGTYPGSIEEQIISALAICKKAGITLVWKFPRISRTHELDAACALLQSLHKKGLDTCMAESAGAAYAVRQHIPEMQIVGGIGLNVFNHDTVREFFTLFSSLTLSPEISGAEIRELVLLARADGCDTSIELIAQGSAEAMVSEDCLLEPLLQCVPGSPDFPAFHRFYGIRDSTSRIFPVRIDGKCRTHIFNVVETCLIDHIPSFLQTGIGSVAIDARYRTPVYADQVVRIYKKAIAVAQQDGHGNRRRLTSLKKRVKEIALGGITAGHFMRGLKEA